MNPKNALLNLVSQILRPSVFTASRPLQFSIALLRLLAGVVMVHNGLNKLGNVESFAEAYVSVIGLPFPIFFTYVAAFTELLAAPLLALGLLTRPAALGLLATMLVAIYHHIKVAGLSIPYLELSVLYAACFQFFLVAGGGLFSTDALIVGWVDNAIGHGTDHAIGNQQRQSVEVKEAAKVSAKV